MRKQLWSEWIWSPLELDAIALEEAGCSSFDVGSSQPAGQWSGLPLS